MHRVQAANVKAFAPAFEANRHIPGPLYALFYGRDDPATGQSWCPDCVTAKPSIEHALNTVATGTLIECPVDRKMQ
ncbi:hypothetical protein H4R35_004063 [Dimargaris xerosporica]|nr:hypothetical protein H4R35_004063 [Dimargaris xerosporica]